MTVGRTVWARMLFVSFTRCSSFFNARINNDDANGRAFMLRYLILRCNKNYVWPGAYS